MYGENWAGSVDDWVEGLSSEELGKQRKEEFDEIRDIKRDNRGRLNKGAKLAQKDNCKRIDIELYLEMGYTVKQIVDLLGCSKSTVYQIKKQYEEEKALLEKSFDSLIWDN